jgi:hypothetical protein
MSITLADDLAVLETQLSSCLVSSRSLLQLKRMSGVLPALDAGFECRLAADNDDVDLLVCANPENGGPSILAGDWPANQLADSERSKECWRRVADFCRGWEDRNGSLRSVIRNLWLEFDSSQVHGGIPEPSIFLGGFTRQSHGVIDDSLKDLGQILTAFELLTKHYDGPRPNAMLEKAMLHIPLHAAPFQIGVMARPEAFGFRLCITGLTPSDLRCYLKAMGYEGSEHALAEELDLLNTMTDQINLSFDIGERLSSRIGLECSCLSLSPNGRSWDGLFGYLKLKGVCDAAKAEAFQDWRGFLTRRKHLEAWPTERALSANLLDGHFESAIVKIKGHIKLVYTLDELSSAKAYFGFRHDWIRTATSKC